MTGRDDITLAAAKLVERASRTSTMVALAESCTGGMVAAAITDIPGASQVLACGFVVYANDAKTSQLGVSADTIAAHGAVSRETATQMAEGALRATPLATQPCSFNYGNCRAGRRHGGQASRAGVVRCGQEKWRHNNKNA